MNNYTKFYVQGGPKLFTKDPFIYSTTNIQHVRDYLLLHGRSRTRVLALDHSTLWAPVEHREAKKESPAIAPNDTLGI